MKIVDLANPRFPGNPVASTIPLSPVRSDSWMGRAVVPEFSSAELADTVNTFKSRDRALGPNSITSRIWWVVYDTWLLMVESAFNVCLRTGTFLERWKRTNRTLLSNPGKPEDVPSSYQPTSLRTGYTFSTTSRRFSNPC